MKKTLIIGGGVIGASTLFECVQHGLDATLIEANAELGQETSFANGGMLTPSMPEPWNSPGVGKHLISSLFNSDAAMKLNLRAVPGLASWGLRFLNHSMPEPHRHATLAVFTLAKESVDLINRLNKTFRLDYDLSDRGTMKIFASRSAMKEPLRMAEMLSARGLRYRSLNADEAIEVDPQLAGAKNIIAGAIHYPEDRSGDAYLFTKAIAQKAVELGGKTITGVRVNALRIEGGRVLGVSTTNGPINADCVIICAGAMSPHLVGKTGLSLPVKPVKGYSVTFRLKNGAPAPYLPVIDDAMHAAVVPLGDRIRVVGTAEFTGFDKQLSLKRIDNLHRLFERLYPTLVQQVEQGQPQAWAGFRPMSADGMPFIGPTKISGLFVNTGHGHLGWTMAMGSASLIADIICGRKPSMDPHPYRIHR